VILKFGETLMLGGLTENENELSKSGVSFLQSIPGVQYLFSRDEQSETNKSILILLTPVRPGYCNDNLSTEQLKNSVEPDQGQYGPYTSELKKREKMVSNIDAGLSNLSKESSFNRQF
jgi:type II secretory pathway component GspD/PulD (secretin)